MGTRVSRAPVDKVSMISVPRRQRSQDGCAKSVSMPCACYAYACVQLLMNVDSARTIVRVTAACARTRPNRSRVPVRAPIWTCRPMHNIDLVDSANDVRIHPSNYISMLCAVENECATGRNDCSPNADCIDTQDSYLCNCRTGYQDVSSDIQQRPGRRCLQCTCAYTRARTHSHVFSDQRMPIEHN
jgi:hypothetical protein